VKKSLSSKKIGRKGDPEKWEYSMCDPEQWEYVSHKYCKMSDCVNSVLILYINQNCLWYLDQFEFCEFTFFYLNDFKSLKHKFQGLMKTDKGKIPIF
jgi:hypothetical protein